MSLDRRPREMATRAGPGARADLGSNRLLQGLAGFYAVLWTVTAVAPHYRFDWFLENLLVFLVVGILAATYKRFPLSDTSYLLLTIFLSLHTIGAHYTYSETPIGFWLADLFEWERNHYDRVVHFCFGLLLAYPIREILSRTTGLRGTASYFLTLTLVVTASASYEVIEWVVAEMVSPEAAYAYLGTQGDPFDAQKDMGLALSGVALSLLILAGVRRAAARRTKA